METGGIFVICGFVFLSILMICDTIAKIKKYECDKFYENYSESKYQSIELSEEQKEKIMKTLKPTIEEIEKDINKRKED